MSIIHGMEETHCFPFSFFFIFFYFIIIIIIIIIIIKYFFPIKVAFLHMLSSSGGLGGKVGEVAKTGIVICGPA
jgi:hypothetical protein